MKPLDPPPGVESDPRATEMVRLWAANKKLNVMMNVGSYHEQGWDEANAWDMIAADFGRHVARALFQRYGFAEDETIRKFRAALIAELDQPTSAVASPDD